MTAQETTTAVGSPFTDGIWCAELDLAESGLRSLVARGPQHRRARVLVRFHGSTLGYLLTDVESGEDAIRRQARDRWATELADHLRAEGLSPAPELLPAATGACPSRVDTAGLVSIIVCTHDRSHLLRQCLQRLTRLTYANLDIVVVDNAPPDSSTRDVVDGFADERVRYVLESRKGLSWARNAGLAAARGRLVAYTDDDVEVDAEWVQAVVRGFARSPDVRCVTGLVCAADVSNAYEAYFDAKTALWSARTSATLYSPDTADSALYPYSAGVFGTGANMAFTRADLVELGGFDTALGAGTYTRGGEDLDIFARTILSGYRIAYEPDAVVWHHHRATAASAAAQMFGYGSGLTAYVTKLLCARATRADVLRRLLPGLGRLVTVSRSGAVATDRTAVAAVPDGLIARERTGYLYGPFAYLRARLLARKFNRTGDTA